MGDRRRFADAVDECFAKGVKDGREAGDWKHIKPTESNYALYQEKVRSHLTRFDITGDPAHLAAVACNAEILWGMAVRDHGTVEGVRPGTCEKCGAEGKRIYQSTYYSSRGTPCVFLMCEACGEH
jgi:hypothetical protein